MTRRRLRPEDRRALIVAAAADEFGRRGARDARLADIAREAGVTKAVIYDHFPSKGALHAEVVVRASEDLLAAVVAAVGESGDPRARFEAGVRASFELIAVRPDVRTLLLGEPGVDADVTVASNEALKVARRAMAALYLSDPAFLRGDPRRRQRAEHIAQGAIGAMNNFAALGVEQGLKPEALTRLAMDLLWPGIDALRRH
jgi:AcrR family transcriptional regulator